MSPRATFGLMFVFCVVLGILRSDLSCAVAGSHKRVELSFWNGFTGPDGRVMLEIIRKFNKENPDVHVTMQRMEWATYYNKLMVAAVDGRGPELFVIHASTLTRMHRAGFVANVTDLFDGKGGIPTNDFDPYVLEQAHFGKDYVGVPLDIHPQGLYCNVDFLKKAGFTNPDGTPRPPVNREEFLRAAKVMQQDTDGNGHPEVWGFALTNWRENFMTLLPQFGGHYFDKNGRADVANPQNIATVDFIASLVKKKLVPPPENGLGWVGYRQKKVAMVFAGVFMLGDLLRLDDFKYVGAPIPVIGDHPGTMADSHVLCIREGLTKESRGGAERFIRYLSAHSISWAAAGQVPARKSVRATEEFKRMPVQYAFSKQIPTMMYPPRTPILFQLSLELDLAVEKVIRGRATSVDALKTANDNVQKFLDQDHQERAKTEATP